VKDLKKPIDIENRYLESDDKDKEKNDDNEKLNEAEENIEDKEYLLKSLYHRAFSINDKIDHLLFHHNHDVVGKVAQFTPYGIHMVPISKGNNSVD